MKFQIHRQRGIALVITLVMLAIVTVTAIVFLGLARRERASVKVVEDLTTASLMSDVGLARAQAQAVATMATYGTRLRYDMMVSTNFISAVGYTSQASTFPNPTNVSYIYANGQLVVGDDHLQAVRNLQYDARAPVWVPTNDSGGADFRYYLDFNRNRMFETNGLTPVLDTNGLAVAAAGGGLLQTFKLGDPEWIGQLEFPDRPHGEDNRFVGRYAFLALPAGKSLDLNFMHNHASTNAGVRDDVGGPVPSGFTRNQGHGSWEINLAAFFRELNTNAYGWPSLSYQHNPFTMMFPVGDAFNDARAILDYRYMGTRQSLAPMQNLFGQPGVFERDMVDNYGDGPLVFFAPEPDNDLATRPWPGASNTNALTDVQQLFSLSSYSAEFAALSGRLQQTMSSNRLGSYDRHTYYRMLAQMGVDSGPGLNGKLSLNYQNPVGRIGTNTVPWTNAVQFFTNAANLMLKAAMVTNILPVDIGGGRVRLQTNVMIGDTIVRPDFSVNNIQIFHQPPLLTPYNPFVISNEYSATIHRILQVAANIYDNLTNRHVGLDGQRDAYPFAPTVFRPTFTKTASNIIVSGFAEVTNANFLSTARWWDARILFATNQTGIFTNDVIYGQPFVLGAKKGLPNFNEFSVENVVQVTRKLEVSKPNANPGTLPVLTNQMYIVGISNLFGIEGWNSYLANFNKQVQVFTDVNSSYALSNLVGNTLVGVRFGQNTAFTNLTYTTWPGETNGLLSRPGTFKVPLRVSDIFLQESAYLTNFPWFGNSLLPNNFSSIGDPPQLLLYTTNRVRYWMTDAAGRILDFVNLDNLTTVMNIATLMVNTNTPGQQVAVAPTAGGPAGGNNNISEGIFWSTNQVPGTTLTEGHLNQILVSLGEIPVDQTFWDTYNFYTSSKDRAIDLFRVFAGTNSLFTREALRPPAGVRHQVPFTPTRKLYHRKSWQANDPLVHYMDTDLSTDASTRTSIVRPPKSPLGQLSNLGLLNERYNPWGGADTRDNSNDRYAFRMSFKDPGVRRSDDWQFPITQSVSNYFRFPNIGWLGRVHRGTPWQTVYLKASVVTNNQEWLFWTGSLGTQPAQDRRFLEVFTAAPNENAARGLLSVNQAGMAAWSAVLSGVPVISNSIPDGAIVPASPAQFESLLIEPGSAQLRTIVNSINGWRAAQTKTNLFEVSPGVIGGNVNQIGLFERLGDVLGAPALTEQSPYLNTSIRQLPYAFTDEVVERIPQQILSLLDRDEPRFVVYSFGQSLRPAPRSLVTSADFYNLCTNYQITAEVVTKTTFRIEGDVSDAANPLRAVVEEFKVLPPAE